MYFGSFNFNSPINRKSSLAIQEIKENESSTKEESDWKPDRTRYPAPNINSNIFIDDEKTRNGFKMTQVGEFKMTQAGTFVLPVKLPTPAY